MRKIILAIVIFSFVAVPVFAEITKPPAAAIEWWLKSRNKMQGSTVCTREKPEGNYEITSWKVLGIPKPDDQAVMDIVYQYENALPDIKEAEEAAQKKKALEMIGLTEADVVKIKALKATP